MAKPEWLDMKVTLGHLLQAIVLAAGLASCYAAIVSDQAIDKHSIQVMNRDVASLQGTVALLQGAIAARSESLASLQTDITDIKERTKRIEDRLYH